MGMDVMNILVTVLAQGELPLVHPATATVVSSQGQVGILQLCMEIGQITHPNINIGCRIKKLFRLHTIIRCRRRQHLHKPEGAFGASCLGIEK